LFAAVAGVVCFPYPGRLWRHIQHWKNPNALIEPEAPALAPLYAALQERIPAGAAPREALRRVQEFVLERVKYEWDWNTWGLADYLPTVTEALQMGREDCDGRAVVAASLLKKLGYEARLVTDFAHMWVRTEHGDLMGPGRQTAIVATDKGLSVTLRGLWEFPRALAYGVAVFPAWRELIILGAAGLLMLGPRTGAGGAAFAFFALVAGLLLIRYGSEHYLKPVLWAQVLGAAAVVFGMMGCAWRGPRGVRDAKFMVEVEERATSPAR
jgi:hypothetical protein